MSVSIFKRTKSICVLLLLLYRSRYSFNCSLLGFPQRIIWLHLAVFCHIHFLHSWPFSCVFPLFFLSFVQYIYCPSSTPPQTISTLFLCPKPPNLNCPFWYICFTILVPFMENPNIFISASGLFSSATVSKPNIMPDSATMYSSITSQLEHLAPSIPPSLNPLLSYFQMVNHH